jgi:hypothetical protein
MRLAELKRWDQKAERWVREKAWRSRKVWEFLVNIRLYVYVKGGTYLELEVMFAVEFLHEAVHGGRFRVGVLPAWR